MEDLTQAENTETATVSQDTAGKEAGDTACVLKHLKLQRGRKAAAFTRACNTAEAQIARRASEEELKKRLETLNATLDGFMEANDAYVEKVQEVCELEEAEEYATRLTARHAETVKRIEEATTHRPVKLLIGANVLEAVLQREVHVGRPNQPAAVKTDLGWTLTGCVSDIVPSSMRQVMFLRRQSSESEVELCAAVNEWWSTEAFGTKYSETTSRSEEDKKALQMLERNTTKSGERYETGLLWKETGPTLPNNKRQAIQRLQATERKLEKLPEVAGKYQVIINSYVAERHVSVAAVSADALTEQNEFELGQQLQEAQQELQKQSSQLEEQQQAAARLQEQRTTATADYRKADAGLTRALAAELAACRERDQVLSDKASLVQQLQRRAAGVARLTTELADRGAELAAANAAKCRALAQVGEIAAKEINFQYREKKMASEKEVLEKQMPLLLESLKSQAEELSTLRRQHSSRILQLQADLANKMDQLGTEQAEKERLTQQAADLEQRLTELVEKPRLQREAEIEQEENYRQQLRSQERLAQPYKEGVEKAEARSNEMLRSVDELRSLLSSASEQQSQLEVHPDETHTQHGQCLVERDKVILQLRDRLETYEEQLQAITRKGSLSDEAVEATSPSAAAVSRLLWQGMTLTQIFTGFSQAKEQLTATEAESKQFKLCLDQILKDIDKWTPAIQRQREDYEAAVQTINSPTGNNDEALRELETARAKPDGARRRLRIVQHERDRLAAQTADLAMQFCVPLKKVKEARGGFVATPRYELELDTFSAGRLIAQHLVTFRDKEGLQARNQELLSVVRELSAAREELNTQRSKLRPVDN
ncbi:nucleoprotein TPR-like [Amphibalanus amphitrite]|uniref:nucleoprotein TPR-like n=1 Tax=Amphibalanus amphitrite TaxID=1232801 RepID=UPI001C9020E7|nr:nucleoprotein TPR-like [Amphibalanus amphitrite]